LISIFNDELPFSVAIKDCQSWEACKMTQLTHFPDEETDACGSSSGFPSNSAEPLSLSWGGGSGILSLHPKNWLGAHFVIFEQQI
jgi:hypothetical protein